MANYEFDRLDTVFYIIIYDNIIDFVAMIWLHTIAIKKELKNLFLISAIIF